MMLAGTKKGRHFPWSLRLDQFKVVALNGVQPTDARAHGHADSMGIALIDDEARIFNGLRAGGVAVLNEPIHTTGFFGF